MHITDTGLLSDHLEDYFEICQTDLLMQDSAPCHTSKLIKEKFYFVQMEYTKN